MSNTNLLSGPISDRLSKEIALRTFADQFLDRDEEREVLSISNQLGVDGVEAQKVITQYCQERGLIREHAVRESIRERISLTAPGIDQQQFDVMISQIRDDHGAVLSERDVKKIAVSVVDEIGRSKIKRGWFSNWYDNMKRELGLA